MRYVREGVIFLVLLLLAGCVKSPRKEEIHKVKKTGSSQAAGTQSWWIKRNLEHKTPEVSDVIDLSKYDAYYVNPVHGKKKKIFLTFDCGYENGFTPKILDILKKNRVPAAFFVTKPFIRENKNLVKRMKKEGHVVGNHTVHHKSMPALTLRDNKQEINDCAEYFQEVTGCRMDRFLRPPMGEYNEQTLRLTKSMGYRTIFWSMAYLDYDVHRQPGKDYVIRHFQENWHDGAIPLIHNVSQSNAEALDEVIRLLKREKFSFLSLKSLSEY